SHRRGGFSVPARKLRPQAERLKHRGLERRESPARSGSPARKRSRSPSAARMDKLNFGIFDWVEASATLAPAEVYAHKLELAAAADAAGFHGMFLAEHQGTPLSIDGSPSVLLSAIFQRTRRLRAGAL